jgi:hypothetical protein
LFTCFDTEWKLPGELNGGVRGVIYQWELCPETNKRHAQGYAEFTSPVTRKNAQKMLSLPESHFEPRKGTKEQAIAYCSKLETRADPNAEPICFGDVGGQQGKRTDLSRCTELLQRGGSTKDVAISFPETFVKYHKGFAALQTAITIPKLRNVDVVCYWGPTGTGKTHRAYLEGGENAYWKDSTSMWWDGYFDQETVIIDEIVPNKVEKGIGTAMFLRWLDIYPVNVQFKGGYVALQAKKIILTSNYDPADWVPYENRDALLRRMKVVEMKNVYVDHSGKSEDEPIDLSLDCWD